MATVDTIQQMRQMGYNDGDIIANLQSQGISPREINDSLSQLKVKDAVIAGGISGQLPETNIDTAGTIASDFQGMQPSETMTQEQNYMPQNAEPDQSLQPPQPAQYPEQQAYPQQAYAGQQQAQYPEQAGAYPQGSYYPQAGEGYGEAQTGEYGGDYQQYGINTETVNEIADQLITEKLVKTTSDLRALTEFKIILDSKVQKIDERLERIESIIDQLQAAVMRKSLDQAQSIEDIKGELQMTQSNFGKILNPLTDNIRQMERIIGKKSSSSSYSEAPASTKKAKKYSKK